MRGHLTAQGCVRRVSGQEGRAGERLQPHSSCFSISQDALIPSACALAASSVLLPFPVFLRANCVKSAFTHSASPVLRCERSKKKRGEKGKQSNEMEQLCGNCDAHPALWRCLQCDKDVSALCAECVTLHSKTKAFREHTVVPLRPTKAETCRNCEETVSKFECTTCGEANKYLCLGCSLIHPKIKQFRGHVVHPLDEGETDSLCSRRSGRGALGQSPSIPALARQFFEQQVDIILNRPWGSSQWIASVCIVLATFLTYYVAIKVFCGQFASAVHLVTMIGLVQLARSDAFGTANSKQSRDDGSAAQNTSFPASSAAASAASLAESLRRLRPNGPSDLTSLTKEFPNEFSYQGAGRPAVLRPRTRPYQQRTPAGRRTQQHSPRSVLPDNDDTTMELDPN